MEEQEQEEKKEETPEAHTAREVYLFGEEKRQEELRKRRRRLLEQQSIQEGFRFVFNTTVYFVVFVVLGATFIIKSREFQGRKSAIGLALVILGLLLIIKGIFSVFQSRMK